ncbi:MAG: hypothetical protein ACHQUA_00585 [Microgenomates group bacterium]
MICSRDCANSDDNLSTLLEIVDKTHINAQRLIRMISADPRVKAVARARLISAKATVALTCENHPVQ